MTQKTTCWYEKVFFVLPLTIFKHTKIFKKVKALKIILQQLCKASKKSWAANESG